MHRSQHREDPRHANLRAVWQPGESGNTRGRPKGVIYASEELRRQLSVPYPNDEQGRTYLGRVVAALIERAIDGDVGAAREIFDRIQGKPRQAVDLELGDGDDLREAVRARGLPLSLVREEARAMLEELEGLEDDEPDPLTAA